MTTLTIFVKDPSNVCAKLLNFVDKHVEEINERGARVKIEKIDDAKTSEKCKKVGVTRVPSMVDERGKVHVGMEEIIGVFKKNLPKRHDDVLADMYGGSPESSADAYIASQMFRRGKDGRVSVIDSDESDDDESSAMEKALEKNRRKEAAGGKGRGRGKVKVPPRKKKSRKFDSSDEESAGSDDDETRENIAAMIKDSARDEEYQREMMAAWNQNS